MKVDRFELEKQRREEILESGHYVRVEIIIPKATSDDKRIAPVIGIEAKNANTIMMMCMVNTLNEVKTDIMKEAPEIALAQMLFDTKTVGDGIINKGEITEIPD